MSSDDAPDRGADAPTDPEDGSHGEPTGGDETRTGDNEQESKGADSEQEAGAAKADGEPDAPDGEREWRFSVDDVGPDGVTEDTSTPETEPIESGSVDLEHAVFVVLGVALTLGVLLLGF